MYFLFAMCACDRILPGLLAEQENGYKMRFENETNGFNTTEFLVIVAQCHM